MIFPKKRSVKSLILSALTVSFPLWSSTVWLPQIAQAESADPIQEALAQNSEAPEELREWVSKLDATAEAQRLKSFMKNFSKDFEHADGLDKRQLKQSVKSFWSKFEQMSYSTEIESWSQEGPGVYTTVTTTMITGQQNNFITPQKLSATIRSEQRLVNGKITSQTVLAEQSQITSGENPPTVRVNLPETVEVGQDYFFDVIVDEPLGNRILLGAAMEEIVTPQTSLNPANFEITALATGGLFKIGQAPEQPTDQWISALLIQDGGTYLMSRRISVVAAQSENEENPEPQF